MSCIKLLAPYSAKKSNLYSTTAEPLEALSPDGHLTVLARQNQKKDSLSLIKAMTRFMPKSSLNSMVKEHTITRKTCVKI